MHFHIRQYLFRFQLIQNRLEDEIPETPAVLRLATRSAASATLIPALRPGGSATLSTVRRGLVKLDGGELRWALTRERELLGVLADMHEQGLICCELRFRLTDQGRTRLANLGTDGRAER